MSTEQVARVWPHVAALEDALERLGTGTTVPIRLRPNADQATVDREFFGELRAKMWRENL